MVHGAISVEISGDADRPRVLSQMSRVLSKIPRVALRRTSCVRKGGKGMTTVRNRTAVPSQIWSIVLGGGDGRMSDFIQRWLGHPRPKQYCTFFGERSLFQHTLHRASALCRQEHIVTLVAREHGHEAWSQLEGRGAGT